MDDIQAQQELSDHDLAIFNAELDRGRKSTLVAYLLWFFVGGFGGHNFYIGKPLWGFLYLLLLGGGWVLFIGGATASGSTADLAERAAADQVGIFGAMCLAALAVLLLWDMVTLPLQIGRRERQLRKRLLRRLAAY